MNIKCDYCGAMIDETAKCCSKCGAPLSGAIVIFFLIGMLMAIFDDTSPNGYYRYQNTQYYHQGSSWYYYDSGNTSDDYDWDDDDNWDSGSDSWDSGSTDWDSDW